MCWVKVNKLCCLMFCCILLKCQHSALTLYTRSSSRDSRHKWMASTDKLGILSYVSVQGFDSIGGAAHYSSTVCRKLGSSTFLHLPSTNILFSLSSFNISVQPLPLAPAVSLAALNNGTFSVLRLWETQVHDVKLAVEELFKSMKAHPPAS